VKRVETALLPIHHLLLPAVETVQQPMSMHVQLQVNVIHSVEQFVMMSYLRIYNVKEIIWQEEKEMSSSVPINAMMKANTRQAQVSQDYL
jgi:hypothetical protein